MAASKKDGNYRNGCRRNRWMNPYKSSFSVYQEKVTPEVEADVDNERMREGRDLEEYVARRFTEQTGLKTKRALAIFQNNAHPAASGQILTG